MLIVIIASILGISIGFVLGCMWHSSVKKPVEPFFHGNNNYEYTTN